MYIDSQRLMDADTVGAAPMVATATLNVVRFSGRYLNMMEYLPHIAFGMSVSDVFPFRFFAWIEA